MLDKIWTILRNVVELLKNVSPYDWTTFALSLIFVGLPCVLFYLKWREE